MPPMIRWWEQANLPILGLLLVVPLLGLLALMRTRTPRRANAVALVVTSIELALAIWIATAFEAGLPHVQFVEAHTIAGVTVHLGVDGTSVLFLPLTALLAVVTTTQALGVDAERRKATLMSVLLFEWSLLGSFASLNLLQFWLFGLVELIPIAVIVVRFCSTNRRGMLTRIIAPRLLGDGLVLLAILLLGWEMALAAPGAWSFDVHYLAEGARTHAWDSRIGVVLFYGLAVRLALFPFHAWLPAVAVAGWLPINLLTMVSVKVGALALLRFALPVLPVAADAWANWVVALGLTGIVYGALMALLQSDLRRLLAFATVSQNGSLIVGIFALNHAGLQGGLLLALNLCLATAGLFFATALLQRRTGTTQIDELGGLFERLPLIGLTFLAAALGTLAMPGTPGFEAAHLALEGMLEAFHWSAAYGAAAGNVLVASVLLWAYQRIFFTRERAHEKHLVDLRGHERWVAGALCAVIFGVGLYAHPWIETVSASLEHLASTAAAILRGAN